MAVEKFIPIKNEQAPPAEDERLAAFSSPCEGNEPYVLMVLGDSMLPEFVEGDVIVIYPNGVTRDGSYVIAYHDDEHIFRRLSIEDGHYYLKPLNDAYPTVEIGGLDAIKGVIVQRNRPGAGREGRTKYS